MHFQLNFYHHEFKYNNLYILFFKIENENE